MKLVDFYLRNNTNLSLRTENEDLIKKIIDKFNLYETIDLKLANGDRYIIKSSEILYINIKEWDNESIKSDF